MAETEPYKEIEPMMVTTYEKGIVKGMEKGMEQGLEQGRQQGLEQGRQQGRKEAARLLLEHKFGALSEAALARLAALPEARLNELILAINAAPSLQTLGLGEDDKPS